MSPNGQGEPSGGSGTVRFVVTAFMRSWAGPMNRATTNCTVGRDTHRLLSACLLGPNRPNYIYLPSPVPSCLDAGSRHCDHEVGAAPVISKTRLYTNTHAF